jgi:hypothetical protein
MNLETIFLLMVIYQIKHFVADYPMQNSYMLQKFKPDWSFLFPLMAHAGVHSIFTLAICYGFSGSIVLSLQMAILDLVIHFVMDRIKAGPKYLGRYKALAASHYEYSTPEQKFGNKMFWLSLGVDQMAHHLTHYYIIYKLVTCTH